MIEHVFEIGDLRLGGILAGPSCPSAGWGSDPVRRYAVELATGRELLALAVIVLALLTVMWVLARTRRSEG